MKEVTQRNPSEKKQLDSSLKVIPMLDVARSTDKKKSGKKRPASLHDLYLAVALAAYNLTPDKVAAFQEHDTYYCLVTTQGDKYTLPKDISSFSMPSAVPENIVKALASILTDHV